jgi:Na+-driven multidrug efflux pump
VLQVSPEEITEGRLLRSLLLVAAPLLVQNLVLVFQQVVDILFLGRLSGDAVAAVGLVTPLTALVSSAAIFAPAVGTRILAAQRVGNDDTGGAGTVYATGLALAVVIGLAVGLTAAAVADPVVGLFGLLSPGAASGRVLALGASYLTVFAAGIALVALSDTVESGFVAWGDSRAALALNLVALALNVLFDAVLIFGFADSPVFGALGARGLEAALFEATGFAGLGVEGAALATVLGYAGGALVGLAMVLRGRNGGMLPRSRATVSPAVARELLDVGAPTGAQEAGRQLIRLAIVAVVFAAGGAAGLAAFVVGARVATVAFVPAGGLRSAAQTVVGQNVGAGHADRAARTAWLGAGLIAVALAALGLVQLLIPGAIAAAVAPSLEPTAFDLTVRYLEILAYGYPALGAIYLFQAGFDGAGRTRTSFASVMAQYLGVRLPLAVGAVFVLGTGVVGVFWAVTVSNVAAALGLAAYFRHSVAGGMFARAAENAAAD